MVPGHGGPCEGVPCMHVRKYVHTKIACGHVHVILGHA